MREALVKNATLLVVYLMGMAAMVKCYPRSEEHRLRFRSREEELPSASEDDANSDEIAMEITGRSFLRPVVDALEKGVDVAQKVRETLDTLDKYFDKINQRAQDMLETARFWKKLG